MRKLVSEAFTPRAMQLLESVVRGQIRSVAQGIDPTAIDVVTEFSASVIASSSSPGTR